MFCEKCGHRIPDGAFFCEKCGSRVTMQDKSQQTTIPPQANPQQNQEQQVLPPNQQAYSSPSYQQISENQAPKVKKHRFLILVGCIISAFFIIGILVGNDADYIASVKAMKPIAGSSATYEELINNYFQSPRWKERAGENGIHYVDISGTPQNGDEEIILTIRIDPTDDPEIFWYTPHRLMIDGQGSGESYASSFVYELYIAYEYGPDAFNLYKFMQIFSY